MSGRSWLVVLLPLLAVLAMILGGWAGYLVYKAVAR